MLTFTMRCKVCFTKSFKYLILDACHFYLTWTTEVQIMSKPRIEILVILPAERKINLPSFHISSFESCSLQSLLH